jgi:hypothetical protein
MVFERTILVLSPNYKISRFQYDNMATSFINFDFLSII